MPKDTDFLAGSKRYKRVTDLPGVDEVLGKRLAAEGFATAEAVFGKYLVLGRDEERFKLWMHEICSDNTPKVSECYNGLHKWSEEVL